jgi:TonB family protein
MKSPFLIAAVAALGLSAQATASAYTTEPAITLIPLSQSHVAVSSSRPGCDAAAAVDGIPFYEMPAIAEGMGVHGTSQVKIDLTSDGSLAQEQLYTSSGNQFLDNAALKSARLTKFTPEIISCESVAGSYLYDVEF